MTSKVFWTALKASCFGILDVLKKKDYLANQILATNKRAFSAILEPALIFFFFAFIHFDWLHKG
jgi:hypothetical protein